MTWLHCDERISALLGFPYATVSLRAIRSIVSEGKPGADRARRRISEQAAGSPGSEGVAATLWRVTPMASFRLFQKLDEGYGKGCPWRCPFYGKESKYNFCKCDKEVS
jgi:hypothetical protein